MSTQLCRLKVRHIYRSEQKERFALWLGTSRLLAVDEQNCEPMPVEK